METLIIVLIGLVIVVVAIVYFKSKKGVKFSTGKAPKDSKSPYENWLKTMRTVFSGGTKDVQDKFLESEKDRIKEWSFYPDFVVKFNAIIKQFGK